MPTLKKIARFIAALLVTFAAHHALAAPIPGKSTVIKDQTLLVPTQGFQIELGVSNGLIFRSLAKKGDAGCHNGCTQKTTSPDYFKSAGSCIRTCADALVGPGQQKEQAGDVKTCVQARN